MPARRSVDAVVRDSVVLGAATGVFGAAFGVAATTSGLSIARTCALSLLVFTGASQFAAVGVVGAGGSVVSALAGALLLAARNAIYGIALAPRLESRGATRLIAAQLVIDESTAMAAAQDDPLVARRAFWATGLAIYLFWNLGTALGALFGSRVADPRALGLDAAFPAGFVALLLPQLRSRAGRATAALGGAGAALGVPLLPAGGPILLAALGVLGGIWVLRRAAGEQP